MHWSADGQWLVWLAIAIAAGVIEVLTLNFFFLMFAGGALVACVIAGLTGSIPLSVISFALSSAGLIGLVRPPLLRYAQRDVVDLPTGTAALVGRTAEVLAVVTRVGGRVKLAGEIWSARLDHGGHAPLEVGSLVRVVKIEGATAVVTSHVSRAGLTGGTSPSDEPEPRI